VWRLLAANFVILCKVLGSILGILVGITIPRPYAIGRREPNGTAVEARGHGHAMPHPAAEAPQQPLSGCMLCGARAPLNPPVAQARRRTRRWALCCAVSCPGRIRLPAGGTNEPIISTNIEEFRVVTLVPNPFRVVIPERPVRSAR